MQVRWLRRALHDLDKIGDFIAEESSVSARQVIGEIVRRTRLLADQPEKLFGPGSTTIAYFFIFNLSVHFA